MNYDFKFITVKRMLSVDGKPVESRIQAHVSTNGLAYHLAFGDNGKWTVTHLASGYTLFNETRFFKNEMQCKAFIERIANLGNWTQEKPVLSEEIKANVRRIATDCQAMYLYTPVF